MNKPELDAAVKEIRDLEDHDARQRAMDWPDGGQVFGDPSKPHEWRHVLDVANGFVVYAKFGQIPTYLHQEQWTELVRQPGIVNITAKLS